MDAIVLDGEQRSALAVTRSLGRRGVKVIVGATNNPSLSSCSRYCTRSFQYPSPYEDPNGFMQAIKDATTKFKNSVLFPITDVSLTEVLLNKNELQKTTVIPFVDYDKYRILSDKIELIRLGRKLNISLPTSFLSTDFANQAELFETVGRSGYPVVVKSNFSKIRTNNGWIDAKVLYATNENELRDILSKEVFQRFPFLVQRRLEGQGMGIFLLMRDGEVIAKFSHKRIREKPPSGGVSVLSESIVPPVEPLLAAVRILKEVRWTGVAMVEFKIDMENNVVKLLEVNARFWGSLQLAISSGVDFPYLLYLLGKGENIEDRGEYTVGLRSRWELGDLDHLLIRFFKKSSTLNLLPGTPSRGELLWNFMLDFIRPSVKNEIFQCGDVKPFFLEFREYCNKIMKYRCYNV